MSQLVKVEPILTPLYTAGYFNPFLKFIVQKKNTFCTPNTASWTFILTVKVKVRLSHHYVHSGLVSTTVKQYSKTEQQVQLLKQHDNETRHKYKK